MDYEDIIKKDLSAEELKELTMEELGGVVGVVPVPRAVPGTKFMNI